MKECVTNTQNNYPTHVTASIGRSEWDIKVEQKKKNRSFVTWDDRNANR